MKNVSFTNQNKIYKGCWDLAIQFLERQSPNMAENGLNSFSLVVDMNVLFENFVAYLLNKNRQRLGIESVQTQFPTPIYDVSRNIIDRDAAIEVAQKGRLDILLKLTNGNRMILDTKYKKIDVKDNTVQKVSVNDLYQMLSYSHLHRIEYEDLPTVLVYPQYKERFEIALQNSIKSIHWNVFSIDLHENLALYEEKLVCRFESMLTNIAK